MTDLFGIVFSATIGGFCLIPAIIFFLWGNRVYSCCEKVFWIGAYLGAFELMFFMLAAIVQSGEKL